MERSGQVANELMEQQEKIVTAMQGMSGDTFQEGGWSKAGIGGGRTFLLDGGDTFERAAINVSEVAGPKTPSAISEGHDRIDRSGKPFRAAGLSMIVHPRNPMAPSFHANFRYFEVGEDEWWFGGGMDLTPFYGFDDDAVHFHQTLRRWCDNHPLADYEGWKTKCDNYFYLRHRQEMRGVGGVFFDHLAASDAEGFERIMPCILDGVGTIVPAYLPVVERRKDLPYGAHERRWQELRRGRYVEFNLIYDRGTLFGLQTGVNVDSVLMSMPPSTGWQNPGPLEPGSREADLARFLRPHVNKWAGLGAQPAKVGVA